MKLILIRHGRPITHATRTPPNPPLADIGQHQAVRAGRYLVHEGVDAIAHSGMTRAAQTAQPLIDRLGITPIIITNLGEVDRQGVDYANADTIKARGPDEWRRFLVDPIAYFGLDPVRFREETLAAFTELLSIDGLETVAIFTHGFPINIMLSQALGLPTIGHFLPDYGSISRITGNAIDRLAVVSVNETAHLGEACVRDGL